MPAQTIRNIINRSLRKIGARSFSESTPSEESDAALYEFNDLVSSLVIDNLWNYSVEQSEQSLVPGQEIYTIGLDTSDYPIARPHEFVSIEVEYNNAWRPLKYYSPQDYVNAVKLADNDSSAYPYCYTYFPDFPEGRIEFYPKPSTVLPVRLNFRNIGKEYTLDDVTDLPREYEAYYVLALAVKLGPEYGADSDMAAAVAFDANNVARRIRNQNTNSRTMATSGGRGKYDARSNTYF